MTKIWFGAAVAIAIFLLHNSASDQRAAYFQSCSAIRCT